MSGNVWEWCEDSYSPNAYEKLPGTDPVNKDGGNVVIRGGSWGYDAAYIRCSCRSNSPPDARLNEVGFRLVRKD